MIGVIGSIFTFFCVVNKHTTLLNYTLSDPSSLTMKHQIGQITCLKDAKRMDESHIPYMLFHFVAPNGVRSRRKGACIFGS